MYLGCQHIDHKMTMSDIAKIKEQISSKLAGGKAQGLSKM